jgi:hypothetical protein
MLTSSMQDLYMRKLTIGRQVVYYMVAGPNGNTPNYYRDGFPHLVHYFPTFFCTMQEAAMAAAQLDYLIHIDDSLCPPKHLAFLPFL